jgi:hypothetical protein
VSFTSVLLRSARMTVVAFVVLVVTLAAQPVDVSASHPNSQGTPMWKDSYSRRFPGCVSLVLWPADQLPVAYVTRTNDGALSRVRAELGAPATGTTIGACR